MFSFYSIERVQLPWKNYHIMVVPIIMERCYITEMPAEKLNNQILSFSPFQLWIVPDQSMIFDCLEQIIHEETVLRRWPYFVVLSQGNRELAKPDCCLIDQHDERNNAVFLRTNKQTNKQAHQTQLGDTS